MVKSIMVTVKNEFKEFNSALEVRMLGFGLNDIMLLDFPKAKWKDFTLAIVLYGVYSSYSFVRDFILYLMKNCQ